MQDPINEGIDLTITNNDEGIDLMINTNEDEDQRTEVEKTSRKMDSYPYWAQVCLLLLNTYVATYLGHLTCHWWGTLIAAVLLPLLESHNQVSHTVTIAYLLSRLIPWRSTGNAVDFLGCELATIQVLITLKKQSRYSFWKLLKRETRRWWYSTSYLKLVKGATDESLVDTLIKRKIKYRHVILFIILGLTSSLILITTTGEDYFLNCTIWSGCPKNSTGIPR